MSNDGEHGAAARPVPQDLGEYLFGPPRRTEKQLAKQMGVDQSTVSMWKNHKRVPSLRLAVKLARITGVPIDALIPPKKRKKKAKPPRGDDDDDRDTTDSDDSSPDAVAY